ncbi:MAG TPA: type II secretion system protein [Patescibacteria group bacterium]
MKNSQFSLLRSKTLLLNFQFNKGFTMLELLISIAVLGVIASVVILAINPNHQIGKARDSRRKTDVASLAKVVEEYYVENFRTLPATGTYVSNDSLIADPSDANGNGWIPQILTNQTKVLPIDPLNDATHFYRYCADTATFSLNYEIDAFLEADTNLMSSDGGDDPNRYEIGTLKTQC